MASTPNRRLELHDLLESICPNCYFSPPANKQLKYPCITYNRANNTTLYADNKPYLIETRYIVTVIDQDPDSEIVPEIEKLSKCTFDRHYESDNLNHDVFTLYY